MAQQNPFNGNCFPGNSDSLDRGAKIALWGSAISTFGDALQTIGGALAIEEGRIADAQQQQALDNLQNQIDELKKANVQNKVESADVQTMNKLLEKLVKRLDKEDEKSVNTKDFYDNK